MSLLKLLTAIKGGTGSGNFAHSGRPGKKGGSAPRNYANMTWEDYRTAAGVQNMGWSTIDVPPEIEVESEEFFDYLQNHGINYDALKRYSDFSYDINAALRNGESLDPKQQKIVSALDEIFEHKSSRAPKDMIVTRGGVPATVRNSKSFTDNGFTSTSTGYASNFGDVITIKVPKGSKAVFNTWSGEDEVILPRGSQFKRQPDDTWLYIEPS